MLRRFVLESSEGPERVDKVLARLMPDVSRTTVQRWISEGRVLVDGRTCRARQDVASGALVEVEPGPPLTSNVEPDPLVPFTVIFEDEHLIVVDKPAGVVVHPGRGHREGTLVAGLLARPGFSRESFDPRDPEGRLRPGIVHRIDKGTSGILVAAKDDATREGLKTQLSTHTVERVYRALTVGVPKPGKVETLHSRHRGSRFRFTTFTEHGRLAITHVSVDEELASRRAAAIACRLETGRTHQIRVHLAERCATPLLGDPLYGKRAGDEALRGIASRLGRQALHASVLGFMHPITRENLRFESLPPADMQQALAELRALG